MANNEERRKVLETAIDLVGWLEVGVRIKTKQDHELFDQLRAEFRGNLEKKADTILKEHGIAF